MYNFWTTFSIGFPSPLARAGPDLLRPSPRARGLSPSRYGDMAIWPFGHVGCDGKQPRRQSRAVATARDATRRLATRRDGSRRDAAARDATRRLATRRGSSRRDAAARDATRRLATARDATRYLRSHATRRDLARRDAISRDATRRDGLAELSLGWARIFQQSTAGGRLPHLPEPVIPLTL